MLKFIFAATMLLISYLSYSQEPIDVTDQTIKIKGMKQEEIQFGFAAGDKIIFNFREVNNKDLKEIEIVEYPSTSKFSDFKTTSIENKTLSITKNSIFTFRFKNSAIAGRVCNVKIQRIPANEGTRNYNTSVSWVTKQDTIWNTFTKDVVVGYDTTYVQKTKKEIVSTETTEEIIIDKTERVHSETNANGNKREVTFTLPENSFSNNKSRKVISWVYWIGVGKQAETSWKQNVNSVTGLAKAAGIISPLGALAIGTIAQLATPQLGEDVMYVMTNLENRNLFFSGKPYRGADYGKGIGGYRKFIDAGLMQGRYYLCMINDNVVTGIDVMIKVSAIVESTTYEDKTYTEQVIKPRYEKRLEKEPIIKTSTIPVSG